MYTLICDDSSKYRFSKAGKLSDQNDCSYCCFCGYTTSAVLHIYQSMLLVTFLAVYIDLCLILEV